MHAPTAAPVIADSVVVGDAEIVELQFNSITDLPSTAFAHWPRNVTRLSLDGNSFATVRAGTFTAMQKLDALYMS